MINQIIDDNKHYFDILNKLKEKDISSLNNKVFLDFNLISDNTYINSLEPIKNHIKEYIENNNNIFDMESKSLSDISIQLEIEYLQNKITKKDAQFYCSFSDALVHYGIYMNGRLPSFKYIDFWSGLLKMIYILNLMNTSHYTIRFDDSRYILPGFNELPRLVKSAKNINEKLKENIDIIDGIVVFREGQEERIVRKIERKLSQLNLFNALRFIFYTYDKDKSKHKIELTMPYKYIINILIKNISKSNNKSNDEKKLVYVIELLTSFISLYQLKDNQFAMANISSKNLAEHLKKQVLYSNFYPIYYLKTNTLIEYIENIVKPSINEDLFFSSFGFYLTDLVKFFFLLDKQVDDIIVFSKDNIIGNERKILEIFSVDANAINENYGTINNLLKNFNVFTMNPILKYKRSYYIIGFKYFKLNFYNSLLDRIRKKIDNKINAKVGLNIDFFVEKTFYKIQSRHGYEMFSGRYTPPKKEKPESDLLIRTESDIILIENKNKYLTHPSFSGSVSDIIKDFVLSFVFSQKQLLKHERNLKIYKEITFTGDQRKLKYENQNIVKISISTNNWYSIMNNPSSSILPSIINLRFDNHSNKDCKEFEKANKYLKDLGDIIKELNDFDSSNMGVVLNQTVFLPLELIIDKYRDNEFIDILKSLVAIKMNTDNILNVYDYCKYIKSVTSNK
ncbi:hypothetical protein LJQ72_07910 [Pectobacterium brasiliense]|uniref:hypothetical protein n=2 Tax=Pectobacterium brasiliense TaxID=180957 RepID=UPI001D0D3492|nr:hypothetical protein [Pectobacterium brasiliense]UDQ77470.1 hypothetical protein LJQ72_07910 [Pectobacterium brasiliense]